ncbi:hypothetical protein AV530_013917 [Patagioenas fasciata monilis]|uniref:Uncharacterized protein n=1 Tax=Patagioenas fasciata monilis TaxID=372326 RepID=A0A1V4KMW8_PATFA|nr:hypothetical protein AV530_013917 [Patagioenas fasciata monilis]
MGGAQTEHHRDVSPSVMKRAAAAGRVPRRCQYLFTFEKTEGPRDVLRFDQDFVSASLRLSFSLESGAILL